MVGAQRMMYCGWDGRETTEVDPRVGQVRVAVC